MADKRYKHNWTAIYNLWLSRQIASKAKIKMKDFAKECNVPLGTLKRQSVDNNWEAKLDKKKIEINELAMVKATTKLAKTEASFLLEEIRVREENFKIATSFLDPILKEWKERIKKKDEMKKAPLSLLIKGMQLCLRARKESAGLPDTLNINSTRINLNLNAEYRSPAENRAKVKRMDMLAEKLEQYLMAPPEDYVDVTPFE